MTQDLTQPQPDGSLFDISAWPIVFARFPELEEEDRVNRVLDSLQWVINQKERFVIIWGMPRHDHDDEPHEDEKQSMIWLKKNKVALRNYCAGYVYITQDPHLRDLLNGRFPVVEKFLAFPKRVVETHDEAMDVANGYLTNMSG